MMYLAFIVLFLERYAEEVAYIADLKYCLKDVPLFFKCFKRIEIDVCYLVLKHDFNGKGCL